MPASDITPPERAELPTVDRFVVRSNRDDEIVVGPLDTSKQADEECARLTREQIRNWIANGETMAGEPIEPPGYRAEPYAIPDPDARAAELKRELDRLAKEEKRGTPPAGEDRDVWLDAVKQTRAAIEGELNA